MTAQKKIIYCLSNTDGIGDKIDLTDPYGRKYCTATTRPANFNCVSQCDDSPVPLITLGKP